MKDIQKMFNRKSYQASINDPHRESLSLNRKFTNPNDRGMSSDVNRYDDNRASYNNISERNNRMKTQPIGGNPQLDYQPQGKYHQNNGNRNNIDKKMFNEAGNSGNLPITPSNKNYNNYGPMSPNANGYKDSLDKIQVPGKQSQQQLPNINSNNKLKLANQISLNIPNPQLSSNGNVSGNVNGNMNVNVNGNMNGKVNSQQPIRSGNNAIFRPGGGGSPNNGNFRVNY